MLEAPRDIDDFLPNVLTFAASCPDPVAIRFIREAARTLCERTRCWRQVDHFDTTNGRLDILVVQPDATVHEIERVWFRPAQNEQAVNGWNPVYDDSQTDAEVTVGGGGDHRFYPLEPRVFDHISERAHSDLGEWLDPVIGVDHCGSPRFYTQSTWDTLRIAPHAAGTVRISMFLKPSPTALTLPNVLFERYSQAITDGALSRILLLDGQEFHNPQLAAAFNGSFVAALDANFNAGSRGQQRASRRTRASYF